MPAMSAPEPSPSRMKSRIVSTGVIPRSVLPLRQMFRYWPAISRTRRRRDREGESPAVAAPVSRCGSLGGRLGPAGRLDPLVLAAVREELRAVVADAWRARVVAALKRRGAKGLRALERLDGREDRARGQVGVADLVEDLVDGHH